VEIDNLLTSDDIRVLVEVSETAGTMRSADLAEIVETHELDALEQDALLRELETRGIEIVEDAAASAGAPEPEPEPELEPAPVAPESTTDALQLFLRDAGRHELLTAAQEVELAKRISAIAPQSSG